MRITLQPSQYVALTSLLVSVPGAIGQTFSMDGVAVTEHAAAIDHYGPPCPAQEADPSVSRILKAAIDEDCDLGMVRVTGAIDKELGLICVMLNEAREIDLVATITY